MKYLVMECHSAYAVVLGDDGRFLKVANLHYEVGDTVSDVTELAIPRQEIRKLPQRRWVTALAAMAACLALVISTFFSADLHPYASVYVSINPEVRIDVNRKDMVVGVEGVNEDGITLVSGYHYRNKDLDLVVDELVDLAIDLGYLHEGGKIILSLDADDEWITSHRDHLSSHLNAHLTEKIPVTVDVETKRHHAPDPTLPTAPIVIPAAPQDYSDSDYGESREDRDDPDDDYDNDLDDDYDGDRDDGPGDDYDDDRDDGPGDDYDDDRDDGPDDDSDDQDDDLDDEGDSPYRKPAPTPPSPSKTDPDEPGDSPSGDSHYDPSDEDDDEEENDDDEDEDEDEDEDDRDKDDDRDNRDEDEEDEEDEEDGD